MNTCLELVFNSEVCKYILTPASALRSGLERNNSLANLMLERYSKHMNRKHDARGEKETATEQNRQHLGSRRCHAQDFGDDTRLEKHDSENTKSQEQRTCGMAKWVNARNAFSVYDNVLQSQSQRAAYAVAQWPTYPAKFRVIGDMSTCEKARVSARSGDQKGALPPSHVRHEVAGQPKGEVGERHGGNVRAQVAAPNDGNGLDQGRVRAGVQHDDGAGKGRLLGRPVVEDGERGGQGKEQRDNGDLDRRPNTLSADVGGNCVETRLLLLDKHVGRLRATAYATR